MTTDIRTNNPSGPDNKSEPLAKLLKRLTENTLDPRFEQFGNFILPGKDGKAHFWGNFFDVSAQFDILTDDQNVIATLRFAIRANQNTARYMEARKQRREAAA